MHQKRQIGVIFQTAALLGLPEDHQQASKSTTCLGKTQDIPKQLKRELHKAEAHIAMEKKMIHRLPSFLTHIAFVYHDNMPLPKVVQGKDLVKSRESHFKWYRKRIRKAIVEFI